MTILFLEDKKMKYNFDSLIDRKNTNSYKWDNNKKFFGREDILPFFVADMDFPCAEPIVAALQKRISHPVYGYTIRSESYTQAICGWLKKRYNWVVNAEWLCFCPPGVMPAISILLTKLTNPGDDVIVQTPVYKPLMDVISKNDRNLIRNPFVLKNGSYTIDFCDLEKKITPETKLMLFCSPHNPIGRVWTRDELNRLGQICLENGTLIISDEIHADLVLNGYKHVHFGSLAQNIAANSVTCISASKTFNIPGLQLSTLIIPDKTLREMFIGLIDKMHMDLGNLFGEVALEAAYNNGEDWLDQVLEYIENNVAFLSDFCMKKIPGIEAIKPQGTYLVWLDCRGLKLSDRELENRMLNRAKVGLYPGHFFGETKPGFFRINVACPRSLLKEGLERIKAAFSP